MNLLLDAERHTRRWTLLALGFLSLALPCHAQSDIQDAAQLSEVSSWQAGMRLHLGISTTDKSFDRCTLYFSPTGPPMPVNHLGVDIVIDPRNAQVVGTVEQRGARPSEDNSDAYKWYVNTTIDASAQVGDELRYQARLTSPSGRLVWTNGIIRRVMPSGDTEKRYATQTSNPSNGEYVSLSVVDLDDPNVGPSTKWIQLPPAWFHPIEVEQIIYQGTPQISPDGSTIAISLSRSNKRLGNYEDVDVLLYDIDSGAYDWLPTGIVGGLPIGNAQFRPGQSDRIWVLHRFGSPPYTYQFASYDTTAGSGHQPALPTDPVLSFGHGGHGWTFDAQGSYVYFLGGTTGSVLVAAPCTATGIGQSTYTTIRPTGKVGWHRGVQAVPESSRVLLSVWDGQDYFYGSDFANGVVLTAPFNPPGGDARSDVLSEGGSFGLITAKSDGALKHVFDGTQPFVSGAPLPMKGTVAACYHSLEPDSYARIHGSVVVSQNCPDFGGDICRIEELSDGSFLVEHLGTTSSAGNLYMRSNVLSSSDDAGGLHKALDSDSGAMVLMRNTSSKHMMVLDTDTLTWGPAFALQYLPTYYF